MNEWNLRILLVEDDERLARLIATYLERHAAKVIIAIDGVTGRATAASEAFDCVVLDVQLPGCDGISLCRDVRGRSHVPIVMVSAHTDEDTRVNGFEAGADDFLAKPYHPRELLARIHANVRRARHAVGPCQDPIRIGRVTVDRRAMVALLDGRPVRLTSREFVLLQVLAEHAGEVVSRERLLDLVGTTEHAFGRAIDCRIVRLREKFGDDARNPWLLKTIRGGGYMLMGGATAEASPAVSARRDRL